MRATTQAGVRVVVIGNYGAYQERAGRDYLDQAVVNEAFEALGVRYDALWTDDPGRLKVEVRDAALGAPDALAASRVRHFYQITPVRPDVRVMVGATRTDLSPRQPESLHSGGVIKQRAPIHDAHRAEKDDGLIESFNRCVTCRILPLRQCVFVAIHHVTPTHRRSGRPPSTNHKPIMEGDGPRRRITLR